MKKYKKPTLEVLEIELNCNIALQSVTTNRGNNLNTGFNGNYYSEKEISASGKDISDTWGENWDTRGGL